MALRLFALGWISILGQVALFRELNVALFGVELVYVLSLAVWLLGTATGAALGRGAPAAAGDPGAPMAVPMRVGAVFLLLAWVIPLSAAVARGFRPLAGVTPGVFLPLSSQAFVVAVTLLPTAALLGLLFPWAAGSFVGPRRSLGAAYAIECAGGLGGGALATLLLMAGVQDVSAVLLASALALAAAVPWPRPRRAHRAFQGAILVTAALLVAAAIGRGGLDRASTHWTHPDAVASRDTPYGRVTVEARAGQVSVFLNGALAFDTGGTGAEEFAGLASLQRERPRAMLLLGGAAEGLAAQLLRRGPERLDVVELDAALLDLVLPRLPAEARAALEAPVARVHAAEPRRFLERAGDYDLIVVGMPEPASGQANRFYTAEFFALCAKHLSADGVLALRLPGSENRWTTSTAARLTSVVRALHTAFADVVIVPGATVYLFASPAPLTRDPDVLGARLAARDAPGRILTRDYLRYLYTNDRVAEARNVVEETAAPANRDARPVCYALTLQHWLSMFSPAAGSADLSSLAPRAFAGRWPAWAAAAGALVVLVAARRRPLARRSLFVGAGAAAGMLIESVALLRYQAGRGVLYQDLGLLLTAFMFGLAAGAFGYDRLCFARRGGAASPARLGVAIAGGLGLAALAAAAMGGSPSLSGLASSAALLIACGALVAAAFAHAAAQCRDRARAASTIYAADLAGGCLGALAAGLYLIPVVGLTGAALAALVFVGIAALEA